MLQNWKRRQVLEKKQIKVKIDKDLLDKAKEYDKDIETFVNTQLRHRVNGISDNTETKNYNEIVINKLKTENEKSMRLSIALSTILMASIIGLIHRNRKK